MARIKNTDVYDYASPGLNDYLVGTDEKDSLRTKSFRIQEVLALVGELPGDNLGDHVATQDLDMSGFRAVNVGNFQLIPTDVEPMGVKGGLYYDDSESLLKHFDGTSWEPVGGAPDLSNYVTLSGTQTITGTKVFSQPGGLQPVIAIGGHMRFSGGIPTFNDSSTAFGHDSVSDTWFFQEQAGVLNFGLFDFKQISANRTYTWPDASGTVLLDGDVDLSNYVTLDGVQTITGKKSFTAGGANGSDLTAFFSNGIQLGGQTALTGYIQVIPFAPGTSSFNPNVFQGNDNTYNIGVYNGDFVLQGGAGLSGSNVTNYTRLAANYTSPRTHTFQDKNGTLAHLDDIFTTETNTFTPVLTPSGGGGTYTLSSAVGRYVKVGPLVHFEMQVVVTGDTGTPSGLLYMGGLPFSVSNTYALFTVEISGAGLAIAGHYSIHAALATGQTTNLWFKYQQALDSQNDSVLAAPLHTGGNTTIKVSGTYYTTQ